MVEEISPEKNAFREFGANGIIRAQISRLQDFRHFAVIVMLLDVETTPSAYA